MAQNSDEKIQDQEKALKDIKNDAKKIKDRIEKPRKKAKAQLKNQAKNYGKQQAKKQVKKASKEISKKGSEAAKKAAKKAGEAAKKAAQKVAELAKKVAEQLAKLAAKAAKAIGKALVKAFQAIGKAIASLGPYGWIALAIILILVCCYGAAVYNSEKISAWLIGESTADGHMFDSIYFDDAVTIRDKIAADTGNTILQNDMPMLSREDVINILDHVIQYNNDMSFEVGIGAKYNEYTISRNSILYPPTSSIPLIDDALAEMDSSTEEYTLIAALKNANGYTSTEKNSGYAIDTNPLFSSSGVFRDVLSENMSYGQIATLDVGGTEAEKYYNGTYDIDWKLLLVLCEMMAESRAGSFGANGEWSEASQESLNSSGWFETPMDGYFVTDTDIEDLCKLFDFDIRCYPDDMGYDYVQLGKLYADGTYLGANVITNISINWPWDGFVRATYNDNIENAYEFEVVKRMSFTMYPTKDVYGNNTWITSGIVKNDPNNNGQWTYLGPFESGDVFDGQDGIRVDALGNLAVRYANDVDGNTYIINDDDMHNYRGIKNIYVPYIAPYSISNVLMKAEYKYDDISNVLPGKTAESLGMNEGTKVLSTIELTFDADNFYNRICDLIPDFSFEHFYELYGYYKCNISDEERENNSSLAEKKDAYNAQIDGEIQRWRNVEDLYKKGKEAQENYIYSIKSGIAPPFTSLDQAAQEAVKKVTLSRTAISGPTGGLIFIGDNSQNLNSSGAAADVTGRNGVWIGESHGKRYRGFLDINAATTAAINRADKFVEEDEEIAKDKLRTICDELFHEVQKFGYSMANGVSITNNVATDSEYTQYASEAGDCGPFWVHFCSCASVAGGELCNHNTETYYGHTYNAWNAYNNSELIDYLYEWQIEHPNYSLSAILTVIAIRAYMQGNPYIIKTTERDPEWGDGYVYDLMILGSRAIGLTDYDPLVIGQAYTEGENLTITKAFFDYEAGIIMDQIDKGQTSFFDMEFGHGFNNKTISQAAYEEAELKYTYGGLTSNSNSTSNYITPNTIGVYQTWWEDPLFPEENRGQTNTMSSNNNKSWCVKAGNIRASILGKAGYSCFGSGNWPLGVELGNNCTITSPYGWRIYYVDGVQYEDKHGGIDIGVPEGTPILSVCDGKVINFDTCGNAGYMVTILGDDGCYYKFMHMTTGSAEEFIVKDGRVYAGQQIGYSGNTGKSSGPHLHFQIEQNGVTIDPAPFLGVDSSNPYWNTHKVYYTKDEVEEAWNNNNY